MWSRNLRSVLLRWRSQRPAAKSLSTSPCCAIRATVLGAATPAGGVAARTLKTSNWIEHLYLHDNEPLVRATYHDLCDVDTACGVSVHVGSGDAKAALLDTDVVLVAVGRGGGGPVTPAQTLTDNIPLVRDAICGIATYCPCATVVMASEPVNCMVPFAAEILIQLEAFDPSHLLGSSCDSMRAAAVLARVTGVGGHRASVAVLGGRSACTAVPVFSGAAPWAGLPDGLRDGALDAALGEARALWREGAAALASLPEGGFVARGLAAAHVAVKLARARCGHHERVSAFVRSDLVLGHRYFMSEVQLGPEGVGAILGLPKLNCEELRSLEVVLPILAQDVQAGTNAGQIHQTPISQVLA